MSFGERLRDLRKERDLRQSELGEELGEFIGIGRISPSAIGSYERNEREPAYDHLIGMARYFGVSVDYLLGATDERLTVSQYIENLDFEFSELLSKYNIYFDGHKLTDADKGRIKDVSFALLWDKK